MHNIAFVLHTATLRVCRLFVQMATETLSDLYRLCSGGKMDQVLFHCV